MSCCIFTAHFLHFSKPLLFFFFFYNPSLWQTQNTYVNHLNLLLKEALLKPCRFNSTLITFSSYSNFCSFFCFSKVITHQWLPNVEVSRLLHKKKNFVCCSHQISNPISYNLILRGLRELLSKPLCPSSLWDGAGKVLRGLHLDDLFLATSLSFSFHSWALASLFVWHSCQIEGPSWVTCLMPNSVTAAVTERPRASA